MMSIGPVVRSASSKSAGSPTLSPSITRRFSRSATGAAGSAGARSALGSPVNVARSCSSGSGPPSRSLKISLLQISLSSSGIL
jgi:hypothetical protein